MTTRKDTSWRSRFTGLICGPGAPTVERELRDKDNFVDRRRSSRHNLRIPLRLRVWGSPGPSRVAKSVDISEDGALVETDLPLRVGAILDLRIELPKEITGQPTTEWRFKSRVVRLALVASAGHPLKAGVHFDSLHVSAKK